MKIGISRLATTLSATLLLVACSVAVGGDFRSGEDIEVKAEETIKGDLYVAGNKVVVKGKVEGDLLAACRELIVEGEITGSINAAGQMITIGGPVGGTVRTAAQIVMISPNAAIERDLVAFAQTVETSPLSKIKGDATIQSAGLKHDGVIEGTLTYQGIGCQMNGEVGGDAKLTCGGQSEELPIFEWNGEGFDVKTTMVEAGLTLGDSATFKKNLELHHYAKLDDVHRAKIHGEFTEETLVYQVIEEKKEATPVTVYVLRAVKEFAVLLVVAMIGGFVMPNYSGRVTRNVRQRPINSFVRGSFAFFFWLVICGVILAGTISGCIVLGLFSMSGLVGFVLMLGAFCFSAIGFGGILFARYFAIGLVAVAVGQIVLGLFSREAKEKYVLPMFVGCVLVSAISVIPFAGYIFYFVASILGSGALWLMWITRNVPPPPPINKSGKPAFPTGKMK